MAQLGGDMSDTTLTPTATLRYVGVADWWGFHVWIEEGGSRRTLPYRGEAPLASFAWGRPGMGSRELARSINGAETKVELEDLYAPYRPKRRTKAQIAREAGLEPRAPARRNKPPPRARNQNAKIKKGGPNL